MKLDDSEQIIEKYSNIRLHENPYTRSRRTDEHDEAFHSFVNAPKNYQQWAKQQHFEVRFSAREFWVHAANMSDPAC